MPPKSATSASVDATTQTNGTENASASAFSGQSSRPKYPRRPTAKQLAQFIAEILAEDKKPKRSRSSRIITKVKQPKPSVAAVSSAAPKRRLQLRPSLHDHVQTDLQDRGLITCYHERVYIVAKNISTDVDNIPLDDGESNGVSGTADKSAPVVFKMQLPKPKRKVKMDPLGTSGEIPQGIHGETFISKTDMRHDVSDGSDLTTRTSADSAGSEEGEEEDIDQEQDTEAVALTEHRESLSKADYVQSFREKILEIKLESEAALNDFDKLGGLLLCMDDYSLLVVEGTEDMVTEFLKGLQKCIKDFWCENRVFFIEDIIETSYFVPLFYCYRTSAINVNEKFPNATPNDPYLMREQHKKVYNKIQAILQTLANDETPFIRYVLPSSPYNRMMPEVQRLEMVLSSTRFYRTLEKYLGLFDIMSSRNDDVAMVWPQPYDYTPTRTFRYTNYDANLTFPSYGQTETKQEQVRRSSASGQTDVDESSEEQKDQNEQEWVEQMQEEEEEVQPEVSESVAYSQETETIPPSYDSVELFYAQPLNGIDDINLEMYRQTHDTAIKKRRLRPSQQIRWVADRNMLHEKRDQMSVLDLTTSSRHRGFGGYRGRFMYRSRGPRGSSAGTRRSTSRSGVSQLYEKEADAELELTKYDKDKQKRASNASAASAQSTQSPRGTRQSIGHRVSISKDSADAAGRRDSTASQSSVRSGSRPRASLDGKK